MSKFVLILGAGGMAWYWHRVIPELTARGHQAVAVDLPGDDESVGLPEYAVKALAAIGDDRDVVVVGQSLGGFTAVAVCARVPVRLLVLVNAIIPLPGETPGQWFATTGSEEARNDAAKRGGYPAGLDIGAYSLHDVPREVLASGKGTFRGQARVVMNQPCQIDRWPPVPTRILVGADDRVFPPEFQRRLARERLGVEVELLPGGHLVALSQPRELAERLVRFLAA
ncbi:MAG TPA: alpha/beta fold hydrolase [Candidatus Sulfotelmatobacter sp.]|nr:alpha/beta fold hydrolase [Candidatus Sulfotelmatobacter sp.]